LIPFASIRDVALAAMLLKKARFFGSAEKDMMTGMKVKA
jgi:hypothetical protein